MTKTININDTHGFLTVVSKPFYHYSKSGKRTRYITCKCICDKYLLVPTTNWGRRKASCKCLISKSYILWAASRKDRKTMNEKIKAKLRYINKKLPSVDICDEWKLSNDIRTDKPIYSRFIDWWVQTAGLHTDRRIKRYSENKPYSPENCFTE